MSRRKKRKQSSFDCDGGVFLWPELEVDAVISLRVTSLLHEQTHFHFKDSLRLVYTKAGPQQRTDATNIS